jgi:hypothetical protein
MGSWDDIITEVAVWNYFPRNWDLIDVGDLQLGRTIFRPRISLSDAEKEGLTRVTVKFVNHWKSGRAEYQIVVFPASSSEIRGMYRPTVYIQVN